MNSIVTSANLMRGAMVAAAGAAAVGALIKKSLDAADSIGKMADTIGITTTALQELRYAASLSGISQEKLDSAMSGFAKKVGELRSNTGSLVTILKVMDSALLDNVRSASSVDAAFDMVIKRASELNNTMDRSALLAAAFGRAAGTQMAVLLRGGVEGLAAMRKEAHDLGLIMDESIIRQAEEANDELQRMSSVIKTQVTIAFAQLAPYVIVLAKHLKEMSLESGGFGLSVTGMAESVAKALARIGDVFYGLELLVKFNQVMLAKYFAWILKTTELTVTKAIELLNKLPKVDIKIPESLVESVKAAEDKVIDLSIELQDLIDKGMPTDRVEAFFATVREEAEKASAVMGFIGAGGTDAPPADTAGAAADMKRSQDALERLRVTKANELEVIKESLFSQEEVENNAFLNRMLIVEENYELELISLEKYQSLREQLTKVHEDKVANIRLENAEKVAGTELKLRTDVMEQSVRLLQMLGTKSKAFAVAAIALQTFMNLKTIAMEYIKTQAMLSVLEPVAVAQAYAQLGPYAGVAAEAALHVKFAAMRAMATAGAALGAGIEVAGAGLQLANLNANGSTAADGSTGVYSADPITGLPINDGRTSREYRTDITINLSGANLLSADAVRTLIEKINEQIDDGVNVGSIRVA